MSNYPMGAASDMNAPFNQREAREKQYVFKNAVGDELVIQAYEDGDSVLLYIHDKEVTQELKEVLGKDWFSDVESDLCGE